MMKHENCLLKLGIKRTMQKKSTSTDFLPLNLNNETYLYRDWVPAKVEKSGFSSRFFCIVKYVK
ncbi:hypothetical protein, partial [Blautia wexlerae]|jgi:hypothetical protein|uniref:hypothetical protein n=2 Tax=cellular organisms TaxID=131567 RepID=UPI000A426A10